MEAVCPAAALAAACNPRVPMYNVIDAVDNSIAPMAAMACPECHSPQQAFPCNHHGSSAWDMQQAH